MTDAELVRAWRAGDAASAGAVLERHRAGMRAVAVAVLGPGPQVDDVVQEAYIVALLKLESLREDEAVRAWLHGITRNLCRAAMRGRKPLAASLDVADLAEAGGRVEADAGARLERLAVRDWVWSALDELSPPIRHALVLRHFSAASSYEAIAAVLEIPVGTVRSRLSEGRRILAGSLRMVADRSHDGVAELQRERGALLAAIYDQYNSGDGCSLLRDALIDDAVLVVPGEGRLRHGRDGITRMIHGDIQAGVHIRVLDVVAGSDITVVDGTFVNPADDPHHCPPRTAHVLLHGTGGITSLRLHYSAT